MNRSPLPVACKPLILLTFARSFHDTRTKKAERAFALSAFFFSSGEIRIIQMRLSSGQSLAAGLDGGNSLRCVPQRDTSAANLDTRTTYPRLPCIAKAAEIRNDFSGFYSLNSNIQINSAISQTRRSVASQPIQGSVIDLPYTPPPIF